MWWILGIGLLWIIGVIIKRRIWRTIPSLPKSTSDDYVLGDYVLGDYVLDGYFTNPSRTDPMDPAYFFIYWPETEPCENS